MNGFSHQIRPLAAPLGGPSLLALAGDYCRARGLRLSADQVARSGSLLRRFIWHGCGAGLATAQRSGAGPRQRFGPERFGRELTVERLTVDGLTAEGLTAQAVGSFLAASSAAGSTPKTLHNQRSIVSAFCAWLVKQGLLHENPCLAVELPVLDRPLPHWLNAYELGQVAATAAAAGIANEVALALAAGLRVGELARLTWPDVNFTDRQLIVQKCKNHRARAVPLSAPAIDALRAQHAISGELLCVFPARRTFRGGWRYVDRPRCLASWDRLLAPVQAAVGKFGQVGPGRAGRKWHLFRHTFASRLALRNIGPRKLASWMGHADSRAVDIYAHIADGYDPDIEVSVPRYDRRLACPEKDLSNPLTNVSDEVQCAGMKKNRHGCPNRSTGLSPAGRMPLAEPEQAGLPRRRPAKPGRLSYQTTKPGQAGRPSYEDAIGRRIRRARLKAGLTQVQLAERAELSRPNLSNYETGASRPGVAVLRRLGAALGVDYRKWLPK